MKNLLSKRNLFIAAGVFLLLLTMLSFTDAGFFNIKNSLRGTEQIIIDGDSRYTHTNPNAIVRFLNDKNIVTTDTMRLDTNFRNVSTNKLRAVQQNNIVCVTGQIVARNTAAPISTTVPFATLPAKYAAIPNGYFPAVFTDSTTLKKRLLVMPYQGYSLIHRYFNGDATVDFTANTDTLSINFCYIGL